MANSGTAAGGEGVGPTPMDIPTGGVTDGGDAAGGSDRHSGRGPEDRKRLMVATMSPEDLVLCIDVGPEMTSEWLGGGSGGAATSRMLVAKAALRGFVGRKASFNPKHRFAVVALGNGVTVVRSLTSDVRSVLEAIDRLQPSQYPEMEPLSDGEDEIHRNADPPFDFPGLLKCISERFPPPRDAAALERNRGGGSSNNNAPLGGGGAGAGATSQVRPVVRAVVLFGRSYTCPLVPPGGAEKPALLSHRRFCLDCLYVHRPPAEEGVICQDVFDSIAALETSAGGGSFFLACGHSLRHFHSNLAALLAHPAQRDFQAVFFDKLDVPGGSATGEGTVARADSNTTTGGGGGGLGSGGNRSANGSLS